MGSPLISDQAGIRWITLNRPEILNALLPEDLAVIAQAVREPPESVDAIVLTGSGDRAFSSGMHKETFVDATPATGRAIISSVADCLAAVRQSDLPIVAMIHGYCLGAAFEMVLSCDLRVAGRTARFGLPEVKLGIPSVVDAALLRQYVGLSKAKEIILTGDTYTARDLEAFGLVNRFADQDDLRAETVRLVDKVAPLTREVVAAQKGLFETWMNTGLQQSIDQSIEVFADMFESPATLKAIARYNGNRPS